MALEDFMEPEVGVAVALTAAVASPQVRSVLRRGAVYGLAGILMAGDAVSSLAQGVKRGAEKAVAATEAPAAPMTEAPAAPMTEAPAAPMSEAAAPEILSAAVPVSTPAEPADAAPAAHKRGRKTAEAPDNE